MIERVREVMNDLGPIPCTRCEYCLPCSYGVNIPRNFDIYNKAAMFDDLDAARRGYGIFLQPEERAAECTECGECLEKCPQHIEISTWMPVVNDVLGNGQPYVTQL